MDISVRLYGLLIPHVPKNPLSLDRPEGSTLADLINYMAEAYGPQMERILKPAGDSRFPLMIMVDSKEVREDHNKVVLSPGAIVDLLSPMAGG
ncbi:MAG TPA: MoaD/ThiS family protein [Syntrophales bacterium]|nr:MoaD/ThiS family protein [Syntrophales bacterium]